MTRSAFQTCWQKLRLREEALWFCVTDAMWCLLPALMNHFSYQPTFKLLCLSWVLFSYIYGGFFPLHIKRTRVLWSWIKLTFAVINSVCWGNSSWLWSLALVSHVGVFLFTLQSHTAGVQDSFTATDVSWPKTCACPSHVPMAGCAYRSLKVTCATAHWTTLKQGRRSSILL